MAEFGEGIALTSGLNLQIDDTGDVSITSGSAELEKDIATRATIDLEDLLGNLKNEKTESEIRTRVRQLLEADPRVDSVNTVEFSFGEGNTESSFGDTTTKTLIFTVKQ